MILDYGSPYDGYSRTPLRVALAAISGIVFFMEAYSVAEMTRDSHYAHAAGPLHLLPNHPASAWLVFALITLGLVMLAIDRFSTIAGTWAIAWMSVLSQWQRELFGTPSRNSFFPGVMLFGWVLGLVWARAVAGKDAEKPEGRVFRERIAEVGAMACIAAGYTSSALSKLFAAGFDWINSNQVRWLVLAQEPLGQWPWLVAYRNLVIESPRVAWFSAFMTIVIEGGGFFLLFGPRSRLLWTVMIWALHINIILLCVMPYLEPMALLLVFALPWPRIFRRPRTHDPLLERRPELVRPDMPDAMWLILTAIVVLAWVLPIGWRAG
ncbi:MAG: hypothetical protein IPM54_14050 [Polyangiaceae bacterium]|nr:hypothetical protein [Polyangiaceae bacterium]